MKLKFAFLLIVISAIPSLAGADITVGSTKIPESVTFGDQTVDLNGAGMRKKLFIKVYVGALYTAEPSTKPDQLIASNGNKSMRMHIVHKKISAKKIRDAWTQGLRTNLTADKFATVKARLERFNSLFPDLQKGDIIEMNFQPGKGTEVVIDGSPRGSVEGDDFFSALMLVWIGDKPADPDLKQGILGR